MLKILWKREEIAPVLLSLIFCYLMLDSYVKRRIRFSFQDKLFNIFEFEITRVDCVKVVSYIKEYSLDRFPTFSFQLSLS